ncbi:MAG: hypothetical protein II705_08530 [Clostridia bacterium]|nr:hypothetical protein [Clostridia bacterium]
MVKGYGAAVRSLWSGVCTVYASQYGEAGENGRNVRRETALYENIPCRLSRRTSSHTVSGTREDNETAKVTQTVKLFTDRDVEIPPGARVTVTQNGRTVEYERAGESMVYSCHRETVLELKRKRA